MLPVLERYSDSSSLLQSEIPPWILDEMHKIIFQYEKSDNLLFDNFLC